MNIFFDIDYTLVGEDNTLRPGVEVMLQALLHDHVVYAWSGDAVRTTTVEDHGLTSYFSGVMPKPTTRYREIASRFGVAVEFTVDDYPQVVRVFGGVCVSPYFGVVGQHRPAAPIDRLVLPAVAAHLEGGRRNEESDVWCYSDGPNGLETRRYVENVLVEESRRTGMMRWRMERS